jgi:hypothetical protein
VLFVAFDVEVEMGTALDAQPSVRRFREEEEEQGAVGGASNTSKRSMMQECAVVWREVVAVSVSGVGGCVCKLPFFFFFQLALLCCRCAFFTALWQTLFLPKCVVGFVFLLFGGPSTPLDPHAKKTTTVCL